MADAQDTKLLKTLNSYKLPHFRKLQLIKVDHCNSEVVKFLTNLVTSGNLLDDLYIEFCSGYTKTSITKYTECLVSIAPFVKTTLCLNCSRMSKDQFMSLVTAAKHVENLQFNYCVILTDSECDFGNALEGATIKNLELYY